MSATASAPTTPVLPSPESLFLPAGYRQQQGNLTLDVNRTEAYWSPWRLAESGKWQRHVYEWAARLVRERGLRSVLDVGCGVATKLVRHILPLNVEVHAVDQPTALEAARLAHFGGRKPTNPTLTPIDLDRPEYQPGRTFDLIICADVLEHLVDPAPALAMIRACSHERTLVLLSTPERDRERGRDCMASNKPEHVREWSRAEFAAYVRSQSFAIMASRLFPKDDAPAAPCREREIAFRLRREEKSPLCCQALLCRVSANQ